MNPGTTADTDAAIPRTSTMVVSRRTSKSSVEPTRANHATYRVVPEKTKTDARPSLHPKRIFIPSSQESSRGTRPATRAVRPGSWGCLPPPRDPCQRRDSERGSLRDAKVLKRAFDSDALHLRKDRRFE